MSNVKQRCVSWDTEVITEDCMVSERCQSEATEVLCDTNLWFCDRHMKMATLAPELVDIMTEKIEDE